MKTPLAAAAVMAFTLGGIIATADSASGGGDHKEFICHPNGGGWSHISVDKHSSHFGDDGTPKHEWGGRWDTYSVNGYCPGEEPTEEPTPTDDPTVDPTPTDDPDPTTDPTPTDEPTTDAPEPTQPADPDPSHGVLPEFDHPNADTGTATSTEIVHRYTCTAHIATTWELVDGERTRVLDRDVDRYPNGCGGDGAAAGEFNPSEEG